MSYKRKYACDLIQNLCKICGMFDQGRFSPLNVIIILPGYSLSSLSPKHALSTEFEFKNGILAWGPWMPLVVFVGAVDTSYWASGPGTVSPFFIMGKPTSSTMQDGSFSIHKYTRRTARVRAQCKNKYTRVRTRVREQHRDKYT